LLTLFAQYAKRGLRNGPATRVRPSVCPIDRQQQQQQQQRAAERPMLLSAMRAADIAR